MAFIRHKTFISFYHYDDQWYRNWFEGTFGHLMVCKAVDPGDIDDDNSANYIKRLIQEGFITDASVVMVLIGPNTRKRKHVDWEISAGLSSKVGGPSGLMGIALPELPKTADDRYLHENMPHRFVDNLKSKYASFFAWNWITADYDRMANAIDAAFQNRVNGKAKIDNSRTQMQRNLT